MIHFSDFLASHCEYAHPINEKLIEVLYSKVNFFGFMGDIKFVHNYVSLVDLIVIDTTDTDSSKGRFKVIFILKNYEEKMLLKVIRRVDHFENDDFSTLWPAIKPAQKEAWDLMGLKFLNHGQRLVTHRHFNGHPLQKNFKYSESDNVSDLIEVKDIQSRTVVDKDRPEENWLTIKPYDFNSQLNMKLILNVNEGKIDSLHPEIGFDHKGLEKVFENTAPHKIPYLIDDISNQSLSNGSFAYCRTYEELTGIVITERGKALRMINSEFGRVCDHLNSLILSFKEISYHKGIEDYLLIKESLHTLLYHYCGNRYLKGVNCIGGVRYDIPVGWSAECIEFVKNSREMIKKYLSFLTKNKFFYEQFSQNTITPRDAVAHYLTGPKLRASGVNYDLRRDDSYYFYNDLKFDIPVGIEGSLYDLFIIKNEEILQSLRMIIQLIDNLPFGEKLLKEFDLKHVKSFDTLIKQFKGKAQNKDHYTSIESSNGEFGVYLSIADEGDGDQFQRVKLRTPSFYNLFALMPMLKGKDYENTHRLLNLTNIISAQVDR
ncbi:MAG: NADH-quinone oxidoreductase subunit C/D [Thermoproteota archaeon]|jgi:NADH-quinone oxidoreductase subunit C/D